MTLKQINRAKSRAATITLDKEDEPLINTFISAKKLISKTGERCKNIDRDIERIASHIELFQEMIVELKEKKDYFGKEIELMSKYLSPSSVEEFKYLENRVHREEVNKFDNSALGKVVNFFRCFEYSNLYCVSEFWDKKLNELMDNNNFVYQSSCWAKIGDTEVWIGNHPYASFSESTNNYLPKKITRLRAAEKLLRDTGEKAITDI